MPLNLDGWTLRTNDLESSMALTQIVSQTVKRSTNLQILAAARKANMQRIPDAAFFPAIGKKPICQSWKPYLTRAGVHGSGQNWADATGFCVAPIQGSKLAICDIDDQGFGRELLAAIPDLKKTYTVRRGPHAHIYIHLARQMPQASAKLKNPDGSERASLRGTGAYVIGAGSQHFNNDGQPSGDYYVGNDRPIASLNEAQTNNLFRLFGIDEKPTGTMAPLPRGENTPPADDWQQGKAREYIDDYRAELRAKQAGRNDALNFCAYQVGHLAHYLNNDEHLIELLYSDAVANGYVAKDKERATRATIRSGFDAGKLKPRYPFGRQDRRLGKADTLPNLEPAEQSAQAEDAQPAEPVTRHSVPSSHERAIRFMLGRQADAVLELVAASSTQEYRSVAQMAGGVKARERKFYRAFDEYGAEPLYETLCHDDQVFSSPLINTQIPDRRDTPQQQAKLYRLRSSLTLVLLDLLAAHIADKHDVPRFNRHQIAALGIQDGAQDLADAINAQIDAKLSKDERAERDRALSKALAEYRQWERDLQDMTVAPVEGDTPVEQTVARVLAQVGIDTTWHKVEVAASMPRERFRRNLHKLGKTTEERYGQDRIVSSYEGLPTEYDPGRRAFPAEAVTDDGELLNLRSPVDRQRAYEALRSGEKLRIKYVEGITIRDMTADELTERDKPKERKAKSYASAPRKPAQVKRLGPDVARIARLVAWAETVCKLPPDGNLTLIERIYRLADPPDVDTDDDLIAGLVAEGAVLVSVVPTITTMES